MAPKSSKLQSQSGMDTQKKSLSAKDLDDYSWVDQWWLENPDRKQWPVHEWKERFLSLSKKLSSTLRHTAAKEGFKVRKDGFLPVAEIATSPVYSFYTAEDIVTCTEPGHNKKDRFELKFENGEQWVRARQGHSAHLGVDAHELTTPVTLENVPNFTIHGTFTSVLPQIEQEGLKTMGREHIHIATGLPSDDTVVSGCRTGTNVFIFIDVSQGIRDGIEFLRSGNDVILTGGINGVLPPKYFIGAIDKKGNLIFGKDPTEFANASSKATQRRTPGAVEKSQQQVKAGAKSNRWNGKEAVAAGEVHNATAPSQSVGQAPSQLSSSEKEFLKQVKNLRAIMKLEETPSENLARNQKQKLESKPQVVQAVKSAEELLSRDSDLRSKNADIIKTLAAL